jgi:hypothetical protein
MNYNSIVTNPKALAFESLIFDDKPSSRPGTRNKSVRFKIQSELETPKQPLPEASYRHCYHYRRSKAWQTSYSTKTDQNPERLSSLDGPTPSRKFNDQGQFLTQMDVL